MATFDTHLAHMDTTIEVLSRHPSSDANRVVLLTWSYGAEVAARVQMDGEGVRMVVGLSSNPLAAAGVYNPDGVLTGLDVTRISANYVVMTEAVAPDGTEREPPSVMSELPAWSAFVRFDELSHGNFNVLEGMIPGLLGITEVQPWSRGGSVAKGGYETVARYVLAFLKYGLEEGNSGPDGLRPWETEAADGPVHTTWYGR